MSELAALARFLADHPRLLVLTGAGCSTDSGIPDYRDAQGQWKRSPPVTIQAFVGDTLARQRYWARSLIGWQSLGQARPNAAHRALAQLEAEGRVTMLLTQNVDGLHQAAGSHRVIDLHGRIDTVRCRQCQQSLPRGDWQQRLLQLNPDWTKVSAPSAPDGDADLESAAFASFHIPDCPWCGGMIKPDVVFFGENVPRPRVDQAFEALRQSDAMLVVGSSLMVYSGYRFVQAAAEARLPVAALNLGRTRADELLDLKVDLPCAPALGAILLEKHAKLA